ncbi:protein PIGMENT DEFECTIVE 338, chloroplastic [Impatiens glandulifera]|uniref:protein PIGMENT DEFECTIVE 338, chloroplastic n=1 Tax=Impatiens glandulifera TaxID=253017 RepID=UPI001FB1755D|nr:protein PIGMENT DEFECTIVE 338, chloroplastic [Impatiens glandulifera]
MPLLLLHPTVSFSLLSSSSLPPPSDFTLSHFTVTLKEPPLVAAAAASKSSISRPLTPALFCPASSTRRRRSFLQFCSKNEVSYAHVHTPQGEEEIEELGGLIGRPTPCPKQTGSGFSVNEDDEPPKPPKRDKDEALKPFLKFFRPRDPLEQQWDDDYYYYSKSSVKKEEEEIKKVVVKYYDPKPGEFVIGVIVSGNENKLDVNIGADLLGTMLTKEVLPLYEKEMDYLLFDTETDAEEFMVNGKVGIVKDKDAISSGGGLGPGRPVLEPGTVLFAQVLGRTLSGRPLLSTRRLFRRMAWHRVRQIKQLNEPIEVRITEWNTGGLLTRIEGLRAFLPKNELVARVNNFTDLKENVGRRMHVLVTRIDDASNNLILSEKDAWEKLNLREGSVLKGTVRKIYPYGAQIRIDETNRSGLLHISNISRDRVTSVSDLLAVDEKVKVMVAKSMFPDKIALSIADLESEPGLFLSNKEKVYSEAEEMAKKYRQKLSAYSVDQEVLLTEEALPFHDEENFYSNWKWFKFEKGDDIKQ